MFAVACLLTGLTGLTGCGRPREPTVSLSPADTLKAAQLLLTERCLTRQGLTPPRPGERPTRVTEARRVDRALFGTGRAELTLKLPSGHVIGHHTDGCLAAAERRLYGDQDRWFRAVTNVNNLKSKAPSRDRAAYRELRAHALTKARALLSAEAKAETSSNKS
ncbi:hypothetical protein [Streptomyces sp. NRRL B-1347]|uniref:hypothetical protein n=1 Tax=Streptomyces sp. NRRL B-1347 TaxID=1476877 RepID=UPI00055ADFEF|nr:hypothetical protein [Streptomyces sp. NRRL B-1347]